MRLSKHIRKLYWNLVLAKRESVTVTFSNGMTLDSPSKNISARNTFLHGRKDPRIFRWMDKHIAKGATVIDVGANVGAYALYLAKLVGPLGKVIAVEPASTNLKFLKKNIDANHLSQVSVESVALGAEEGELVLSYCPENAGEHHISTAGEEASIQETVHVERLDDLVKRYGNPDATFVKIDVEGFEHNVLLGFVETLRTQSPTLLIEHAKAGSERYGAARQETVDLMQSLGYRAYRLRRTGMSPYDWERGRGDAFWSKSPIALN